MNEIDPISGWRNNPFFVLEVKPDASRAEIERAGQRLLALLFIGSSNVQHFMTPLGPANRDSDTVRQALAALRDPGLRLVHELWADVAPVNGDKPGQNIAPAWEANETVLGWAEK